MPDGESATAASPGRPQHYDNLDACLDEAWRLIARGAADRRSPFHTVSLATLGLDGWPQARTLVLRDAARSTARLRLHTDRRAPKLKEIAAEPRVSLHLYDPGRKIQIRIRGEAKAHLDGPLFEEAWAKTRSFSRICYQVTSAPGAALATPDAAVFDAAATGEGRAHFAVIEIAVLELEWLYLAAAGHRRALFRYGGTRLQSAEWLVP